MVSEELVFNEFIINQINFELSSEKKTRAELGIFFTNKLSIIDQVVDIIKFDSSIFTKKILDPACGHGIFLLRIVHQLSKKFSDSKKIFSFIENNVFFADIDSSMIQKTEENLQKLCLSIFGTPFTGHFNSFHLDFTHKKDLLSCLNTKNDRNLYDLYSQIDYVVGNPPYVTLYGRRDKKKNEFQRKYYLKNYQQFPSSLQNGKINYTMLFIEHSLDFLKSDGKLSFILDTAIFETPYLYTRKYLLENSLIESLVYNITSFDVASGQVILKLVKQLNSNINNHYVKIIDASIDEQKTVKQSTWYNSKDEFKFRTALCEYSNQIIDKVINHNEPSLKELYPNKNLRTCTMLLDMEDKFVFNRADLNPSVKVYPYYRGSKSLKEKFDKLTPLGFFYYDKKLQDLINDRLKLELEAQGIKNKKRIGLGEEVVYDLPKVYIRQSAKSIIATYDENPSSANNSLYIFTLRKNSKQDRAFLRFICGYFNSDLITFLCQKMQIIRYRKGKQPQIKISDLYSIPIPSCNKLQSELAELVSMIYANNNNIQVLFNEINDLIYNYYHLEEKDVKQIKKSIQSF